MKKIAIIGVPLDLSIFGHVAGCNLGPAKLRELGLLNALKKNRFDAIDLGDISISGTGRVKDPTCRFEEEVFQASSRLRLKVQQALGENRLPIVIGGDHSVSLGSVAGVIGQGKKVGLIWIDAHPDLNTPETTSSGNIHGMTLAGLLGRIDRPIAKKFWGSETLRSENVVLLGLRNIDSTEAEFIRRENLEIISIWDIERIGIEEAIDQAFRSLPRDIDHLHLSFDLDVVDEIWAPGVGIASRGGLTYREALYLSKRFSSIGFSSLDIVELNPKNDLADRTAELALELVFGFVGINYGPYERFRERRGPLK